MKKVSLLMLSLCLLVSACKDKNALKSPEEVKEAAIERVQDFLEDLYDKDVDGDLEHCLLIISDDEKYEEEYPFPETAFTAALQHNVEYSPKHGDKCIFCGGEPTKNLTKISLILVL